MPYYADGTEAKVGDQVTGKLYNSEGIKAGVIVSITPGQESCNAKVSFLEALKKPGEAVAPVTPRMALFTKAETESDERGRPMCRIVRGENHGDAGDKFVVYQCEDYCATNQLNKVG